MRGYGFCNLFKTILHLKVNLFSFGLSRSITPINSLSCPKMGTTSSDLLSESHDMTFEFFDIVNKKTLFALS